MDNDRKEGPRRKTIKKKKRRAAAAGSAEPALERPRPKKARAAAEPPPPDKMSWTVNHVIIAAVVGLGLGAMGGYSMGKDGGTTDTSKDSAQAAPDSRTPPPGARPAEQAGRVYVPLASWSPRKGPEHAKVTILDFSDFQ